MQLIPESFAATVHCRTQILVMVDLIEMRKESAFHWSQNTFRSRPGAKVYEPKGNKSVFLVEDFGIPLLFWKQSLSAAVGPRPSTENETSLACYTHHPK